MARTPGVRAKNGYWYSEAGGVSRYFGRVDGVSRSEAMARLWRALAGGEGVPVGADAEGGDMVWVGGDGVRASPAPITTATSGRKELTRRRDGGGDGVNSFLPPTRTPKASGSTPNPPPISPPTVSALMTRFLEWLMRHRSEKTHTERSRHLRRFAGDYGDLEAVAVTGAHLEAFTDSLRASGHALDYVQKHAISVGAMFHRGVKLGLLPPGFTPFASVEPIRVDRKPLSEADLPTDAEIRALLAHADDDMGDIIGMYHATGARTHELLGARVGDFQRATRTLVLGKHKRSRTLREPIPRTITLNADAFATMSRHCEKRNEDAPVFTRPSDGKPYSNVNIAERFQTVRNRAGVRSAITIYSFRHLWISEAIMAGVDVLLTARMAGTSVKMIETVYGHFRTQSYADAQSRLDAVRASRSQS